MVSTSYGLHVKKSFQLWFHANFGSWDIITTERETTPIYYLSWVVNDEMIVCQVHFFLFRPRVKGHVHSLLLNIMICNGNGSKFHLPIKQFARCLFLYDPTSGLRVCLRIDPIIASILTFLSRQMTVQNDCPDGVLM